MKTLSAYYSLVKPGVLYGNAITTVAGFLFASRGDIDLIAFLAVTAGSTCVIASACVLNNHLDRDIDRKMERTKKRATVAGTVTVRGTLVLAAVLGSVGMATLILWTSWLVAGIGLIGYVTYVVLYGMWSKRQSMHGTLVGSVSGAIPILAGYVAASGAVDLGAVLVFAVLFFWQQPEFYSIAIYRRAEYAAAGVPLLSVVKGVPTTIRHIFFHVIGFTIAALWLTAAGYTSVTYAVVMGGGCLYWIFLAIKGLKTSQPEQWARHMFHYALVMLIVFSFIISIDAFLP